jgi:hypothetical protein
MTTMNVDDPRHGTANGYHNLGCRCAACRAAWVESCRAARLRRRSKLTAADPRHGRYTTYINHMCRCPLCRTAWADRVTPKYR